MSSGHNCIHHQCKKLGKIFVGQIYRLLLKFAVISDFYMSSWWRHQMEAFSALLAICAGNSLVPGEFPTQRPVTRSFDVFFDLRLNKWLNKQGWSWWFETLSRPLCCHRNVLFQIKLHLLNTALLPGSFEIHWVRKYLVNFMGLAGIVNSNVYKTKPIFTGPDKLS